MKNAEKLIQELFRSPVEVKGNLIHYLETDPIKPRNQHQTEKAFEDKWATTAQLDKLQKLYNFQYEWFFQLYGFKDEKDLKGFLSDKRVIFDAGCGLGYKAAWFAELAPDAIVIGMDISDAVFEAAKQFESIPNLFFVKGDISKTSILPEIVEFVICDQVIMHTESPESTFRHLAEITKPGGQFACYVYAKKALPRELLDEYFRSATHQIDREIMWEFASQVTELGRRLSELNSQIEVPDIPLLGIKGGVYDVQRFIYWNFLKCFWREDWGFELCRITNFDWYAPSNAKRYSKEEFTGMTNQNNLDTVYFHEEEACYAGRFLKK